MAATPPWDAPRTAHGPPLTADDERLAAEWALGDALAGALGDQAERVERRLVPGLAGRSLVDVARAAGAQLLVLAGGGTASVLPGTTSQYVLRKAPCPNPHRPGPRNGLMRVATLAPAAGSREGREGDHHGKQAPVRPDPGN